ncbi:hypothetical protein J2T60_001622 [Natronospira proteinivora]|uniref:Uncharacterized protein n=1 Tax=Natronospira proteinivora TaxID=1807133 RepID=A0ABT1G8J1_9GAMM|nr:hypothetical protein [Natronospira proteinivora]MCP1727622.1 hypothetical protein [Natronospira proteinivora]
MNTQNRFETGHQATLAATGEKVTILYRLHDGQGGHARYRGILPPQAPGHRERIQTIRAQRLA